MAGGDAPSWADQWGAGGIGAMDELEEKKETESNKKTAGTVHGGGLGKAKAAAVAGAQKVKIGTSMSFNWIKNQVQKKKNNKTPPSTSAAATTTATKEDY